METGPVVSTECCLSKEDVLSSEAADKNWVGKSLPRKEENRLLRGRGKFADDIKLRDMLYLHFVRSPYAHARIVSIDTSEAERIFPGVVCALTGAEIAQQTQPFIEIAPDPFGKIQDYPLAVSKSAIKGNLSPLSWPNRPPWPTMAPRLSKSSTRRSIRL